MGNKLCCDESHEKLTEMEKLEDDVIFKISVVNRERAYTQEEKNEQLPTSSREDKTDKNIPPSSESPKIEEPPSSLPQIELPSLSTSVR